MARGTQFMRKLCILLFLLTFIAPVGWAQGPSARVGVLPFVMHSRESLPDAQRQVQELLIRQLSEEGVRAVPVGEVDKVVKPRDAVQTVEQGRSYGHRLQADYVVIGSINVIGDSVSLDAKLVDVSGRKKTEPLFAEERGLENLASTTKSLIQQMTVHVLAKAVIADVQVRGNDRIEAEAIKANVKSKKGEVLNREQVSEDIKAVYKMGYFEKVEVEMADGPGGKILTFVVEENPTIAEVKPRGNKKIKEKDIMAAITTKSYMVLQKNVVAEDVQKIIKLYHQKGYFDVDVQSKVEFPKDPRRATVIFEIKEQKKVLIQKIGFRGNKKYSARRLRSVMQTKEKNFLLSLFTDRGILQKDMLATDVDRLTVFYHDQGYMDAKVGNPDVTQKSDGFYIEIPIDEGQRYKVADVKITGDLLETSADKKTAKELKTRAKDYFSREKVRKDIDNISKAYMDEGYALAQVNPEVKRDPASHTAEVVYNVSKKDKVHIGKIYVTGNTKTRDKVIRRQLKLAEGDLFNATNLEKSLLNLKKLDYFEEVEITPVETAQGDIMDLHVKVKEKLTGTISVGGGYASQDGLFTSAQIQQRNLFGRGQTIGIRGYLSEEAQRYVLSFTEPYLFDMPLAAGFDIFNWIRDYDTFTQDSYGIRLRTGYPFGSWSRMSLWYTIEEDEVTDISRNASKYIKDQRGKYLKSAFTLGFERDTTDHPFLPTRGSLNTLMSEFSSSYIGSDSDYVRTEIQSGWYHPLFWKFIGFAKAQYGYIFPLDDRSKAVPIYERFFLGGINNLRGWKWADIGPRDSHGDVVGGYHYMVLTGEILFPLVDKYGIRGVTFFDAGNSYREKEDIDFSSFRTDAGVGLRWNSPMGPLRIEWAYNLDPKPKEDNYQWQFSAGAFF